MNTGRPREEDSANSCLELSVVIPCHNGAKRLPETLDAVRSQLADSMEIVVVDDVSNDATADVVASWVAADSRIRLVRREGSPARAAACNAGIAAARGRIVLLLDDDMTLAPGTLAAHQEANAERDRWAFLGRIKLDFGGRPIGCFERYLLREEEFREQELAKHNSFIPYHLIWTGHFSAKKADVLAVGGFNERITHYGLEDLEFGYRLTRAGVKVGYLPSACSFHRSEAASFANYVARHWYIGAMAERLLSLYGDEELRVLLKLHPLPLALGKVPLGLSLLRLEQRLLLRRGFRTLLGSKLGFAFFSGAIHALEHLGCSRLLFFLYRAAADVRYFQGLFGEAPR
jgi:GT2 family glycosyltransferase